MQKTGMRKSDASKMERYESKSYQDNTNPKGVDIKFDSDGSEFENY